MLFECKLTIPLFSVIRNKKCNCYYSLNPLIFIRENSCYTKSGDQPQKNLETIFYKNKYISKQSSNPITCWPIITTYLLKMAISNEES
jgi:hypothetical protein